ncbi:MAG TPA: hypothetical protein VFA44_12715 [Gaiellaceae bacterium]|nr:hypothetical protein [Gaiellaceae bacterium]
MRRRHIFLAALALAAAGLAAAASARTLHYALTVVVTGPGHVTGSGDGGSIDCPDQCSALIRQTTSITLTAAPEGTAVFAGWGGDCAGAGTSPTCTVAMTGQGGDGSKSVTAGFGRLDHSPPRARPIAGTARAGTTARLFFTVSDDSGRSRVLVTVVRGTRTLFRFQGGMRAVAPGQRYSVRWRVPRTLAAGADRLCVVAVDAAGNRSARRCAAFTVTR